MENKTEPNLQKPDPGGRKADSPKTVESGQKDGEDLVWYKKEVRQLRGKIQGYQALSSLLQESKHEIKRLKISNEDLLRRMQTIMRDAQSNPSSALHSLASSQSVNSVTEEKRVMTEEGLRPETNTGHVSVASENSELDDMEIVNQEDVTNPDEMKSEHETGQAHAIEIPQSLEIDPYDFHTGFDGDKMQVGGFPQDPFSLRHLANTTEPRRVITPTTPGDISESIVLISPEESVSHQGPLVNQVRQISEALTRNVGLNSPSELSDALARLAIDVLKVEKELRLKQVMINNLCPENEELKNKLEATIKAREESISHLRKEKKELQEKILELERGETKKSPEAPTVSPQGWVHVQNPQAAEKSVDLNERWEDRTRELESLHNSEVRQLQAHLEDCRQRLRVAEAGAGARQQETENLLTMTKNRVEEERKSKAVAIQHFHREQERRHQCETDLLDERRRAATLSDRVAALEAQLTIFQETQLAGNSRSSEETFASLAALSPDELRTQIQILQQQASIFKEDFNRERCDRERVQADKDAMQGGLARYKTDLNTAHRKIRELEQERDLIRTENECLRREFQQIRQSEQDVVRLQSENIRLREQLQQKIEEIRRLTSSSKQLNVYPTDWQIHGGAAGWTGGPDVTTAPETWRCTSCTYDNPGVRSTCEVCGRSRHPTSRSPTPNRQGNRLIPHSGPNFGWTECDTTGRGLVTTGDDLIIDQEGEDQPDTSKN